MPDLKCKFQSSDECDVRGTWFPVAWLYIFHYAEMGSSGSVTNNTPLTSSWGCEQWAVGYRSTDETHQVLENVPVVASSLYIWTDRTGKGVSAPKLPCLPPPFGALGMVQWGLLETQGTYWCAWGAVAGEGSDSHSLTLAARHWILLCNCRHKARSVGNLFPIQLLVHYSKIASNFSFEEFQCGLLTSLPARRFFFLKSGCFCSPLLDSTS